MKALLKKAGFPGTASLRDRYILIATILCLFFIGVALVARIVVSNISQSEIHQIEEQAVVVTAISNIVQNTRKLETDVLRFIIIPDAKNRAAIIESVSMYEEAVLGLSIIPWAKQHRAAKDLIEKLIQNKDNIQLSVKKLLKIRVNAEEWIPAMEIMLNQLLPGNVEFTSAGNLAIDELREWRGTPDQQEILDLFVDVRHAWLQMISEFRLYVSNRFGIFASSPADGMRVRMTNIRIYADTVIKLLDELLKHDKLGHLGFVAHESLAVMRQTNSSWQASFGDVIQRIEVDGWRSDIPWLERKINPVLAEIYTYTHRLQVSLGQASTQIVANATQNTRWLSDFIWLLAGTVIIALIAGFLVIKKTIVDPIAQVSNALRAEAIGEDHEAMPDSRTEEINNLIVAFARMQEQVRDRESYLDYLAHHDPLTSLPNRSLFQDRLEQALARARRGNYIVGLMYLDVDRFKNINDELGHDVGDKLLKKVAGRLTSSVRETDSVARLGGDEFIVTMENVGVIGEIEVVAKKIIDVFKKPFEIDSHKLSVTTSIGISTYENDHKDADSLIIEADTAMYHAKQSGRNTYKFFNG